MRLESAPRTMFGSYTSRRGSIVAIEDLSTIVELPPNLVSVTVYRPEHSELPISSMVLRLDKRMPVIDAFDLMESHIPAQLEYSQEPVLRVGDVLESLNAISCRGKTLEEINALLENARGLVTLKIARKQDTETENRFLVKQSILVKPREATEASVPAYAEGISFLESTIQESKAGDEQRDTSESDGTNSPADSLRVSDVTEDGWWSHACLSKSEFVLKIDGTICLGLNTEMTQTLLQSKAEQGADLSIWTITNSQSLGAKIRKTAVAVGGGAILGTGVVMMATPLHPIGHAMAFGGAGILGTEFEAPRRAMARMSNAVRGSRNRDDAHNDSDAGNNGSEPQQEQQDNPTRRQSGPFQGIRNRFRNRNQELDQGNPPSHSTREDGPDQTSHEDTRPSESL